MGRLAQIAAVALAAALLAGPALAQPKPKPPPDEDIIGSLLDPNHHPTKEEEDEPDTAGGRNSPSDVEPIAPAPGRLRNVPFAPPPSTERGRPVTIEDAQRTPDGPPAPRDLTYDTRIRSSFAAAESYQGPLDGGWTLAEDRSGDRFRFQIVERRDRLEAVWRDLRAKDALTTSGLVDQIQRTGAGVTLSFLDGRGASIRLTLAPSGEDRWRGELMQGDQKLAVTLRRTSP
jgi:hypothetical protein